MSIQLLCTATHAPCSLKYTIPLWPDFFSKFSSIKKEWQAAWLLRAVQCIDLTTLAGDDTETNVNRLCFKAALPIREDIITGLGVQECQIGVGAVCVYSARVREACASLEGTGIPVAAVATGFPSGQTPLEQRLAEITAAVAAGASEIDVVVSRPLVLTSNWPELYKYGVLLCRCVYALFSFRRCAHSL